ncbi:MAG: hypothetical protein A3E83_07300 [Gammaproteobacteria bacterium RIFCSPHIGHO2_12_FULL_41_20]|nr:MAG: hypothetical protein A3E83_07300 [Gammaproteobacteria bacterium RIFCSPHIGHO2_12_FULL_41_20]
MSLNTAQQALNTSMISDLLEGPLLGVGENARRQQIQEQVLAFAQDREIILGELLEGIVRDELYWQERTALYELLLKALQDERVDINRELARWARDLYQKQSKPKPFTTALPLSTESSMVVDLLVRGYVPAYKWGTDVDVVGCLGSDLASPANIQVPGVYILSPMKIEGYTYGAAEEELEKYNFQQSLETARGIRGGAVTLCIPVSCANRHWRLAEVTVYEGQVTQARLWDSLQGTSGSQDVATRNLSKFITEKTGTATTVTVRYAGVQRNGFSCMDFSLQRAYQVKYPPTSLPTSETARAILDANADATQLRLAIVRKAVARSPLAGADNVYAVVHDGRIVAQQPPRAAAAAAATVPVSSPSPKKPTSAVPHPQPVLAAVEQVQLYLSVNPGKEQIAFDELYARALAGKMKEFSHRAEAELDKKAFAEAYQRFDAQHQLSNKVTAFFKQAHPSEPGDDPHDYPPRHTP